MEFTLSQLAMMLEGTVEGDGNIKVKMLGKIQDAKSGELSFLSNPKYEPYIYTTNASAVIVSKDFTPTKPIKTALIRVEDPYTAFSAILEEYHKYLNYHKVGVEQPSFIGDGSTTGEDVYRGAFSYIGNYVKIGNNVKIHPHAYIGDHSAIGDNTIIHSGVKLYANTQIGNNCVLHSGVVIGSDGFGFAPQKDGTYKTIPQLGHVIVEDDVHIGANTTIDCAALPTDATIIRKGVKLDNLIQIAHGVEIKKNTVIAAQSGVSGSTTIGENCIIAGQVGIVGHLTIANNTSIGAQAGINKSVKKENAQITGTPAIGYKDYFRSYAIFKNLPNINDRLRQLEEKMLNLPTD